MSTNQIDIKHKQGTTLKHTLEIKDANGVAVNVSAMTFRGQVKKSFSDTSPLFSFSFDMTDAATGAVVMTLPATFYSKAITQPLQCVYDVELVNGSEVDDLFGGQFIILPEVTK